MTLDNLKKAKIKISDFRKGQETNFLLESAEKQLDYLIAALANDVIDPTKLKNITLGIIAVREVEGIDDSLAEMLYEIELWAKKRGTWGIRGTPVPLCVSILMAISCEFSEWRRPLPWPNGRPSLAPSHLAPFMFWQSAACPRCESCLCSPASIVLSNPTW